MRFHGPFQVFMLFADAGLYERVGEQNRWWPARPHL